MGSRAGRVGRIGRNTGFARIIGGEEEERQQQELKEDVEEEEERKGDQNEQQVELPTRENATVAARAEQYNKQDGETGSEDEFHNAQECGIGQLLHAASRVHC